MPKQNPFFVWAPIVAAFVLLLVVYLFRLNESLFYAINSSSMYLGILWLHFTVLGDGLIMAVLMIPFVRKHHQTVWAMLWAAIVFNIVLHSLKAGLDVGRPPLVLPNDSFFIIGPALKHHSFPSGHTATAFAFAGVIAFGIKNKWAKMGLFVAALLIGLSRIGVGVHWPADVLAGLIVGWGSAWLGWKISERIKIGSGFVFQLIIGALLIASAAVLVIDYNTHYPQADWMKYSLGIVLLGWGIVDYVMILKKKTKS